MQQATEAVPAEVAYAAALERAVRTTEALILAEAQIRELRRQLRERDVEIAAVQEEKDRLYVELTTERREREIGEQLVKQTKAMMTRRTHTLRARAERAERGEVSDGAECATDECAGGEADTPE